MKSIRKISTLVLCAALLLSAAACSNSKTESSVTESTPAASLAASQEETDSSQDSPQSSAEASAEIDPTVKKNIEDQLDVSKLGPKTAALLPIIEGVSLEISSVITTETIDTGEQSGEASFNYAAALIPDGTEITLELTKKSADVTRILIDIPNLMTYDILTNENGLYALNNVKKTAVHFQTADSQPESITDTDQEIKTTPGPDISLTGSGTENFRGADYDFEEYLIKQNGTSGAIGQAQGLLSQIPMLSGMLEGGLSSGNAENTIRLYFSGSELKYIYTETPVAKLTIAVQKFSNDIDQSRLTIPEDYTVTESDLTRQLTSAAERLSLDHYE